MTVQMFVHLHRCQLLDHLECVPVHLNVELKLELEDPLVLAVDGDRSLVFTFIRLG